MLRVVISGATGAVGRALVPAVEAEPDLEVAALVAPSLGRTLAQALSGGADVAVDFSVPGAAGAACEAAIAARVPLVLGTTGLAPAELGVRRTRGRSGDRHLPGAELAIGAVLMMRFAEQARAYMDAAQIIELHADTKKDAPSGTALMTAARMGGDVPIHSVRLPGIVANQEVILGALGQTLTLRHDTTSRDAFVPGVLLAVRRIRELPTGLTSGLEALL